MSKAVPGHGCQVSTPARGVDLQRATRGPLRQAQVYGRVLNPRAWPTQSIFDVDAGGLQVGQDGVHRVGAAQAFSQAAHRVVEFTGKLARR